MLNKCSQNHENSFSGLPLQNGFLNTRDSWQEKQDSLQKKKKNHITEFDQNQAWKLNGNQNLTEFS